MKDNLDENCLVKNLIPHFIEEKAKNQQDHGTFQAYSMFVDLIGFTHLTQTLSKQGSIGAEELSIILNRIFEPLISLVYSHGGFVPYFAGDAFTAIFPSEAQNSSLRRLVQVSQEARNLYQTQNFLGDFTIGIKIGLAYGEVEWGIVGYNYKSFYFRGTAIDRCAQCQLRAKKQDVVIHRVLKDQLTPDLTSTWIESDFFLLTAKDINREFLPLSGKLPKLSDKILSLFLPDEIINFNSAGEFRTVSSVFISFAGLHSHQQLNRFISIILDRVEKFSGYFKEIDFGEKGGVIPIFFGAPVSYENNAERAIEFAISLKEELRNIFAESVKYKIGMTIGTSYTGFIGCKDRCQYAVVGNCVNLAARLMMQALDSEVLVDEELERIRQYKFKPKGHIRYKGFDGDIATFSLIGRNVEDRFTFQGDFIGRREELHELIDFSTPIFQERFAGIAYIMGEAGIGKSRLAYELRKALFKQQPINWFVCKADQILKKGMNPFIYFLNYYFDQASENTKQQNQENFEREFQLLLSDFNKINHSIVQELRQEIQRTKSVLGGLLGFDYPNSLWEQLDARGRFQNVVSSLSALFITESLLRPLVLFLEDGHWYDEVSKSFLNDFIKRIHNFPIILIVTSRYTEKGDIPYLVELNTLDDYAISNMCVDLNLLSKSAIESFATHKLKGTISEEFLALLGRTTNGNPFYLEQVLEYFEESDLLIKEEENWTIKDKNIKLSSSINAILTARIDRLSSLVKETVKTAAVIGQEFELPVLSEVMRTQEEFVRANGNAQAVLKDQVQQAERVQIWQAINELRYIFQHSLLREAVYSMQLNTRLKELHRQIAVAIEKLYTDSIEQRYFDLVFHYEQADITEKTDYYLRKAADYARRNFQNQLALSYYTKILERVKDKTEQVKLLQVQGQVFERIGQWEKAKVAYFDALEVARQLNDKHLLGLTNNSYGKLLLLQGDYQNARMYLEIGATFFEFIEHLEGISKAYVNLGDLYFRQGEYEEAKDYYTKSIEYAKRSNTISPDAQSFANLGLIHMNQGNYETAVKWQKEGIELSSENKDRPGLANLYTSLGIVYFEKGEYEDALIYYKQGLQISKELGDKQIEAIATGCIGRVYERQGNYGIAMENFLHDLQICQELGDKQGKAIVLGLIGDLYSLRGEFEQAIQTVEQGLALSRELGYQKGIAKALNTLGDIHYFTNDFEVSLVFYNQAIEVTRKIDNKLVLGFSLAEKGRSLLASNRLEDVTEVQQAAMALAMELGNPDLIFEVSMLTAKMLHQQGKSAQAIHKIKDLWSENLENGKLATIYYEWSKIEPNQTDYRQKALALYQKLYQATPQFAFKRRIEELKEPET